MNKRTVRHYLLVVVFGVLNASAVSAQVGTTKAGWNDLAPDVQNWLITQTDNVLAMRAEIATLTASLAAAEATISGHTASISTNTSAISGHTTSIGSNATGISGHTTSIATNASDIDGLELSDVPNLGTYLRIGTNNGKPAVIFEAANVLVVEGTGSTSGTSTGLGNVIVGYYLL